MQRITQQFIIAVALTLAMTGTALAQGTQGLNTDHEISPGPVPTIFVGGDQDPNNPGPIPIDLVPDGPPWIKQIQDPTLGTSGPVLVVETIRNVGDEPWFDWHEHVIPDPAVPPVIPLVWLNVTGLTVNGAPIVADVNGLGTPNLSLDNFDTPVLPGQTLEIVKELETGLYFPLSGGAPLIIEQYPTPEPASLALMSLGSLAVLRRR